MYFVYILSTFLILCTSSFSDTNVNLSVYQEGSEVVDENIEDRMSFLGKNKWHHNITLGQRQDGDKLDFTRVAKFSGGPYSKFLIVKYPPGFGSKRTGLKITYIEALDKTSKQKGRAKITSGGVGKKHVQFSFTTDPMESLEYNVTIFGTEGSKTLIV